MKHLSDQFRTLPANIIFVAEGNEEKMSIGYRQFVCEPPELFEAVDAIYRPRRQGGSSGGSGVNSPAFGSVQSSVIGSAWHGRDEILSNDVTSLPLPGIVSRAGHCGALLLLIAL